MFAILAGLMTLLVVLGATNNSRFDGGNFEKALVGLLSLPMLAFQSEGFSKGFLMGVASAALIGAALAAGGLPLLLSLLFLGVASAAFWDDIRSEEIPAVGIVEEYLDDADFTRLIELGERGDLLRIEDEREAARLRIEELEADNLRLIAQLARAYKPAATELLEDNEELQEIFGSLPLYPGDIPHPQGVREPARA